MPEKTFYDEIVDCLRLTRRNTPSVTVSGEVLTEFMTDMPKKAGKRPEPEPEKHAFVVPQVPSAAEPRITPTAPAAAGENVASMGWDELSSAVSQCRACRLCETRRNIVFEDGSRQADLLFFGEGPGADEDAQGIPFVGRAGELLTKMIQAMQFSREEVYICNTVKCRPPGNRNPEPDETEACRAFAERQIELVNPKVIVILGAVPLRFLFPQIYGGIRALRGKWMEYKGIRVMPTYHPAYLLRTPSAKADAWKDLQQVMAVFGKKAPGRK